MSYGKKLWGLSIISKDRLDNKVSKGLNFGIVITLREIYGRNRINDFIRDCILNGWIVNKIDIENKIDIYNANQEEIEFE